MRRVFRSLWTIALCVGTAQAAPLACGNGIVTVEATDAALAGAICTRSDETLARFAACDLGAPPPVTVSVVDSIPANCVGVFHCHESRIELLSPDALEARRDDLGLFDGLPPETLIGSILHHELSHALYDGTPCPYASCVASAEYFAYTQQLSALTESQRAPVAARVAPGVPVPKARINPFILFMDPDLFVATAWADFTTRPDPCTHWRAMLDGDVIFDRVHP
ncbi:DUF6639 family protein [Thetidibacter halocola]|uniref:Uncharacterized protein n=1 Tax=Thetidibacter halocola TaxID=2827239 RepID=A0A8J7WCU7_9RHOB|nr:DUF6639 family protein [Thetidibacter halocola]MBS0122874.1 hypothetical protein [Thetidibacter halocola]